MTLSIWGTVQPVYSIMLHYRILKAFLSTLLDSEMSWLQILRVFLSYHQILAQEGGGRRSIAFSLRCQSCLFGLNAPKGKPLFCVFGTIFKALLANPLAGEGMFYYPLWKRQEGLSLYCADDSYAALFISDKTYNQLLQSVTKLFWTVLRN